MSGRTEKEQELYNIFTRLNIEYTTLYHDVITSVEQGHHLMERLNGDVCLNLLLEDEDGSHYLFIKKVDVDNKSRVDLKAVATKLNISKLKMMPLDKMQGLFGIDKGCATVFILHLNKSVNIKVILDDSLSSDRQVNFHPLRNDATTEISYDNMIKYINDTDVDVICL